MNKDYLSIKFLDKVDFFLSLIFLLFLFKLPASSLLTIYIVSASFITFHFWNLWKDSKLFLPFDWPSFALYAFTIIQFFSLFWAQHISLVWPVAFEWFLLSCLYIIIRNVKFSYRSIRIWKTTIACLLGLNILLLCGNTFSNLEGNNLTILFSTEFLVEVTNSLNTSQNFLSSLLVMMLPFLFYFLNQMRIGFVIKFLAILLYVFLVSIFQSKGAILAIFAISISYLIFNEYDKKMFYGALGMIGGFICIAILFMVLPNEMFDVNEYNPFHPLLNKTGDDRLLIWSNTLEIIKQHCFVGVGSGNWGVTHLQFGLSDYNASLRYTQAHNIMLQTIAETGLLGLLLLLNMFICPIYCFIVKRGFLNDQAFYLLLSMIGYYVLCLFYGVGNWYSFLVIYVGIYAIIFKKGLHPKIPFSKYLLFLFAVLGGFAICYLVAYPIYQKVIVRIERNKSPDNIKLMSKQLAHIPNFYEFRGTESLQGLIAREYYRMAEYDKARQSYSEALKHSPFDVTLLLGKGKVLVKQGKFEEAKMVLQKGLKLDKNNINLHLEIFRAAIATKDAHMINKVIVFFDEIITTKDNFYNFYLENLHDENIALFWHKRCEQIAVYLSLLDGYQTANNN